MEKVYLLVRKKPSHAASFCGGTLPRGEPPGWPPNHSRSLGNLPYNSNWGVKIVEELTVKEDLYLLRAPPGAHVKIWLRFFSIFLEGLSGFIRLSTALIVSDLLIYLHVVVLLLRAGIGVPWHIGLRRVSRVHCSFLQLLLIFIL